MVVSTARCNGNKTVINQVGNIGYLLSASRKEKRSYLKSIDKLEEYRPLPNYYHKKTGFFEGKRLI